MKNLPLFISIIFSFLSISSSFSQTRGKALSNANDLKMMNIANTSSATEFQSLHKNATALKTSQKNLLKVGDLFCIDLQITNLSQRWDVQVSDLGVIHAIDVHNFEGKKIAPEMPNLNTWKFSAQKAGKCKIFFVLPSLANVKVDEQIIEYEIEVVEKK